MALSYANARTSEVRIFGTSSPAVFQLRESVSETSMSENHYVPR